MSENRTTWFEAYESLVLLYPKMTATVAIGAVSLATRMMPFSRPRTQNGPANDMAVPTVPRLVTSADARKRRSAERKSSKATARKKSKRTHSRRKVA